MMRVINLFSSHPKPTVEGQLGSLWACGPEGEVKMMMFPWGSCWLHPHFQEHKDLATIFPAMERQSEEIGILLA